jgi:hypothetical protein
MRAGTFPAASVQGRRVAWVPTDISGNILWLSSMLGITLGGTMRLTGTSPAVTLSGSASTPTALIVRIRSGLGGIVGTSQWEYSTDDGSSYTNGGVTSTPAVAVGSTGFTVSFAAGTYVALDTYRTTVATASDQGGSGNHATQATPGLQLNYVYDATLGKPCFEGVDSLNTRLVRASGGVTGDASHSVFVKFKHVTSAANRGIVAVGATNGVGTTSPIQTSTNQIIYSGNGQTALNGSSLVNGTVYRAGKTRLTAGNTQGYLNGATDGSTSAVVMNLSAGFVVGARSNATGQSGPHRTTFVAAYNKQLSGAEIALLDAYMVNA